MQLKPTGPYLRIFTDFWKTLMSLITVWYELYPNFMIGPTPPCYAINVSSFRTRGSK